MKKVLRPQTGAGSRKPSEPRLAGSIISDMLRSDSRFAVGYRRRKLFEDIFPHTEFTTLKLLLPTPRRPELGEVLEGTLVRDGEEHHIFEAKATGKKAGKTVRRTPILFADDCFNVHLLADGTKRLALNRPRYSEDFTFRDFCLKGINELLAIVRLLGEKRKE